MKKELKIEREGAGVRVRLPSDIDHHAAKFIREEIDRHLELLMPKRLILDFSEVTFMDSSGVGLVMGRVECAGRYGTEVELVGARDGILRLMRICGVERLDRLYIK